MLLFWQICNQGLSCIRQIIFLSIQTFILIFNIICFIKLLQQFKKIKFQIALVFLNILSISSIISITLLASDYQFYLIGYLFQLYVYFLIFFMFTSLALKKQKDVKTSKPKILKACVVFVSVSVAVLIALVLTKVLALSCDNTYQNGIITCLSVEIGIYVMTFWFGFKILKYIDHHSYKVKIDVQSDINPHLQQLLKNSEDQYTAVRKKQIVAILITYSLTVIIRIAWMALYTIFKKDYECLAYENVSFLHANDYIGQIIISISESVILIPHLLLPVALFVIPTSFLRKNSSLIIEEEEPQENPTFMSNL